MQGDLPQSGLARSGEENTYGSRWSAAPVSGNAAEHQETVMGINSYSAMH
jgi:hypothetical protein